MDKVETKLEAHEVVWKYSMGTFIIPKALRKKLDDRAFKCIMVGYDNIVKSYRLWDIERKKIVKSKDVDFDEGDLPGLPTRTLTTTRWCTIITVVVVLDVVVE